MTPMADLFRNIHNETAYANGSSHRVADTSDAEQTDWYFQVNAALCLQLQKVTTLPVLITRFAAGTQRAFA